METEHSFYFVTNKTNGKLELDDSVNFALRVHILKPENFLIRSKEELILDIFLHGIGIIGLSILEFLSRQNEFETLKINAFSLNIERLQIFCRNDIENEFYYSIVLGFKLPSKMLFILNFMLSSPAETIIYNFFKPTFFYYGAMPLTCIVGPDLISSYGEWDVDHCYFALLFDLKNIEAQSIFKEAMDKVASSEPTILSTIPISVLESLTGYNCIISNSWEISSNIIAPQLSIQQKDQEEVPSYIQYLNQSTLYKNPYKRLLDN